MIEQDVYNDIITSLKEHLDGCSDMINAVITPYDSYFNNNGEMKETKKGFQVNIVIGTFFLSARRLTEVIAEIFTELLGWMKEWDSQIHFSEFKLAPISGNNSRIEYTLYFDDILTSAKKMLLR